MFLIQKHTQDAVCACDCKDHAGNVVCCKNPVHRCFEDRVPPNDYSVGLDVVAACTLLAKQHAALALCCTMQLAPHISLTLHHETPCLPAKPS